MGKSSDFHHDENKGLYSGVYSHHLAENRFKIGP